MPRGAALDPALQPNPPPPAGPRASLTCAKQSSAAVALKQSRSLVMENMAHLATREIVSSALYRNSILRGSIGNRKSPNIGPVQAQIRGKRSRKGAKTQRKKGNAGWTFGDQLIDDASIRDL